MTNKLHTSLLKCLLVYILEAPFALQKQLLFALFRLHSCILKTQLCFQ